MDTDAGWPVSASSHSSSSELLCCCCCCGLPRRMDFTLIFLSLGISKLISNTPPLLCGFCSATGILALGDLGFSGSSRCSQYLPVTFHRGTEACCSYSGPALNALTATFGQWHKNWKYTRVCQMHTYQTGDNIADGMQCVPAGCTLVPHQQQCAWQLHLPHQQLH